MNRVLILTIPLFSLYHISTHAFNISGIWKKTEQEIITKEIQVPKGAELTLFNNEGSYTIKPWNQQKILIEAVKKGTAEELKSTSITCKVMEQEATISTHLKDDQKSARVDYTLNVPEDITLKLIQTKGNVKITGVLGDIDISLEEGSIDIADAAKTITAKTGNGNLFLQQKHFKGIFLQTHKGNIAVQLPRETRAILHAKTASGRITSEHAVTMNATIKLNNENWERLKKDVDGLLGVKDSDEFERVKNAAPITLETTKGNISLKEY